MIRALTVVMIVLPVVMYLSRGTPALFTVASYMPRLTRITHYEEEKK